MALLDRRLVAAALALGLPATASAELAKLFTVSASIANGCFVETGAAGAWGSIDLGSLNGVTGGTAEAELLLGQKAGLQLNCTPGTTTTVTADLGAHPSGGQRRMAHMGTGQTMIPYLLFANGASTPWAGEGISISFPVGTSRQTLLLRATTVLSKPVAAGSYSDTVRITVSW